MSVVEQLEGITKKSWESHPAGQPAQFGDIIGAYVLAEDMVQILAKYRPAVPQVLDNVYARGQDYLSRRDNTTGIDFNVSNEGCSRFVEGGGIDHISFETHPEWTLVDRAAELRWLTVSGYCLDDLGKRWKIEYTFDDYKIKKQEKMLTGASWQVVNADAILEVGDLEIIGKVFSGLQNEVVPLLTKAG